MQKVFQLVLLVKIGSKQTNIANSPSHVPLLKSKAVQLKEIEYIGRSCKVLYVKNFVIIFQALYPHVYLSVLFTSSPKGKPDLLFRISFHRTFLKQRFSEYYTSKAAFMVVGCLLCAYFSVNYPAVLESFSTLCTEKLIWLSRQKWLTWIFKRVVV